MIRSAMAGVWAALILGAGLAQAEPRREEAVYRAVLANRAWALDLLKEIVDIDSGTGDVEGGAKVETVLGARLEALGADIKTSPAEAPGLPDNLVATFHGAGKGKILIVSHIDTVFGPGTAAGRPFSIDGDRAHGPGVGDEKAGDVNAVTALKILHDLGFKGFDTITLLLDDSEERGSPGSSQLIKRLAAENDVEFNMEPGDAPDVITVGRNAAMELIHQLDALEGAFPHSGDGTTVNLTLMKAGDRNNIIPKDADATLNVRYRNPAAFEAVLAKVEADAKTTVIPDTTVAVTHDPAFPPLTENGEIDSLAVRAKSIYAEIGKPLETGGNGGASESALAMSVGTPALDGLGYVGGGFHTDHEWIDLNSVTPRLYLFTRLLMEVGAHPPVKGK
jgi:glutamate carboxypeptidase